MPEALVCANTENFEWGPIFYVNLIATNSCCQCWILLLMLLLGVGPVLGVAIVCVRVCV